MIFYFLIHIDIVGVEDLRVVERLQDRGFESVGEEGVFVGGLKSPDQGVEGFTGVEIPVEKTEGAVRDGKRGRDVDGRVEGELDALNQVEGYGVFKTAGWEGR